MVCQWFGVNGFYALSYGPIHFNLGAFLWTLTHVHNPRCVAKLSLRCVRWISRLRTGRRVCERGTHGGSRGEGRGLGSHEGEGIESVWQ